MQGFPACYTNDMNLQATCALHFQQNCHLAAKGGLLGPCTTLRMVMRPYASCGVNS